MTPDTFQSISALSRRIALITIFVFGCLSLVFALMQAGSFLALSAGVSCWIIVVSFQVDAWAVSCRQRALVEGSAPLQALESYRSTSSPLAPMTWETKTETETTTTTKPEPQAIEVRPEGPRKSCPGCENELLDDAEYNEWCGPNARVAGCSGGTLLIESGYIVGHSVGTRPVANHLHQQCSGCGCEWATLLAADVVTVLRRAGKETLDALEKKT